MSRARGRRGAALVMAMLAVAFVEAMAVILAAATIGAARAERLTRTRERMILAAESGAELALARLSADRSWRGARAAAVPGGECAIEVQPTGADSFAILSRASSPEWTCTLRAGVRNQSGAFRVLEWKVRCRR